MNRNHPKLLATLAAVLGFGTIVALASQPVAHAGPELDAEPAILAEVADWQGIDQVLGADPLQAGADVLAGVDPQIDEIPNPLVAAGVDGEPAPLATRPSPCVAPPCATPTPEGSGGVTIDRVWTADVYGYPQTTFRRGETIQFATRLLNRGIYTQRVLADFQAAEPGWFPWCELSCRPLHRVFRGYLSVPRGLWTYAVRARTDTRDPIGQWRYRLTISVGGSSQTRETTFRLR